ncbi:MAG: SUMF1/EgtB/PvdO family nonheme iron enzyme [Chloroflexota bacterium]
MTLDAFWIDQTEVTNEMYALCVADGACDPPDNTNSYSRENYFDAEEFADYPVVYVSWYDAQDYCTWAGRRLPTEAEWEKAARGENGQFYPWGDEDPSSSLLNYDSNGGDTTPAGAYPDGASPYGALDMAGNVWEWVFSLYQPYPYDAGDGREDLEASGLRVLRGGSWVNYGYGFVRAAYRYGSDPGVSVSGIGFRCARSP